MIRISLLATILAVACATTDPAIRGREALARGDDLEATRLLQQAAENRPDDPMVWRDLARAYMRAGLLQPARLAVAKSIDLDRSPETGLLQAQIRMGLGDRDGARTDLGWAGPGLRKPARLQEAAVLQLRLGHVDGALAAAWRAVERSGGEAAAYANVAVLATEGRRPQEAERALDEGLGRHPKDVRLLQTQGALLTSQGRVDEAIHVYRTLLPLHPEPALIHQALALLLHATGDLTAAQPHADAAVAAVGHLRADVHYTRVVILRDRGKREEAARTLAKARRKFPGDEGLRGLVVE